MLRHRKWSAHQLGKYQASRVHEIVSRGRGDGASVRVPRPEVSDEPYECQYQSVPGQHHAMMVACTSGPRLHATGGSWCPISSSFGWQVIETPGCCLDEALREMGKVQMGNRPEQRSVSSRTGVVVGRALSLAVGGLGEERRCGGNSWLASCETLHQRCKAVV